MENKLKINFFRFIFYLNIRWLCTFILGQFYWLINGTNQGKSFSELSFKAPFAMGSLVTSTKNALMHQEADIEIVATLRKLHPKENELKKRTKTTSHNNDGDLYLDNSEREDEVKIVKDSMKVLNVVVALLFYSRLVVETKVFKQNC